MRMVEMRLFVSLETSIYTLVVLTFLHPPAVLSTSALMKNLPVGKSQRETKGKVKETAVKVGHAPAQRNNFVIKKLANKEIENKLEKTISPISISSHQIKRIINPYSFEFILQAEPCTAEDELLIVIHTSAKMKYSTRRMIMRATWLNKHLLSKKIGLTVKIVFFVGIADATTDQKRIEYESEMYRDIVQSNFSDSYKCNTYKAMSYLRWTSLKCAKAKLLMKIDDDALLRTKQIPELKKIIQMLMITKQPIYAGKQVDSRPNRNVGSKWYVSREVWPEDRYPTWFQGLVYFLSPQHTGELFNTSLSTHYMHTDDVFVGIIVSRTKLFGSHVTKIKYLSEFATKGSTLVKTLRSKWIKGQSKFFHIPDTKIYYLWSLEDLQQSNIVH